MEKQTTEYNIDDQMHKWEKNHRRGKVIGGVFIVIIGTLFLFRELGVQFPQWLFTWPMLLIAIGLISGIKHRFKNVGWLILILIGGFFIVEDIFPSISIQPIFWPILIIAFGLAIIFKPRNKRKYACRKRWQQRYHHHHYATANSAEPSNISGEDYLQHTTVFGSIKKNVVSKNFKGGEIEIIMGGSEINLSQADIQGSVTLEITAVFAGATLIIPAQWEIKSELVSIMGGIDDQRQVVTPTEISSAKILVLRGNVVFGGIEIKSY